MNDNRLPKPTPSDYKKREELTKLMKEDTWSDELDNEYLDLMNSFDWGAELFDEVGKYGLKTALGEIILLPLFENFQMITKQELKKGDRLVAQQGGKWGVVIADGIGSWLWKPEFDYIGYPNNITHARKGDKWGVLDLSKKDYLIPLECDHIDNYSGHMFMNSIGSYERGGKIGIVASNGDFTEAIFEDVKLLPQEWVKVKFDGKWGYLDENMKFTLEEDEACFNLDVD